MATSDKAAAPATEAAPAVEEQPQVNEGANAQTLDQQAIAAQTQAANAGGGMGAQPGGRQDPPLI